MTDLTTDDESSYGEEESEGLSFNSSANSSIHEFVSRIHSILQKHPTDDESPRGTIGRFEVIRELGRGSFGVVLLVYDPKLDCQRALKIPTEATMGRVVARSRFVKEAKFAASIDHPNVVRVLEADDLGGLCYLVLEYCPEGSLSAWIKARSRGRPVPEKWAALLVSQIADGVHQAHQKGILHRDLKPGNVLLVRVGANDGSDTPDFCPKVSDFGLAKLLEDGGVGLSVDGAPVGTYAYMSREQARGRLHEITHLSDVYGLGTILFELLARRRVFPQKNREELLKAILSDAPAPLLSEARPGVSKELEIICRTCLAKDPRDRYVSAAALAEDLRRFHRGEAVRGAPLWKRVKSVARKYRRSLALAGVFAGFSLLGGGVWEYVEFRKTGRASIWLQEVEAADIVSLPARLAAYNPDDPRVNPELQKLFLSPFPSKRIAAAVMLVGSSDSRYADHAYDRLLGAEAHEIAPLARCLNGRMANLTARLKTDASTIVEAKDVAEAERLDRRRANAATALVLIGQVDAGLELLKVTKQPQARSFCIHTLGPAGVSPQILLDSLKATKDVSIRRCLLQALGEVPEVTWQGNLNLRDAIIAEAKRLYEEDPNPGVHGSAKWLLIHRGLKNDLKPIDKRLIGIVRPGFDWRITKTGLTLVTVQDKSLPWPLEVSDCETSVEDYQAVFPDHKYVKFISPDPDSPINYLDFNRSAEYCNHLTIEEAGGELAYNPEPWGPALRFMPIDRASEPTGYRLPTDREFEIFCRAGTESQCYYGRSLDLVKYYSLLTRETPRLVRAALKPNDLGLFDTLGNVGEWARSVDAKADPANQALFCGCTFTVDPVNLGASVKTPPASNMRQDVTIKYCGFRVVKIRTIAD